MGTVTQIYTVGYNAENMTNRDFISYKNTSSTTEYITSMTCGFGVAGSGVKYTWGDTVTGNGQPINITISCGSSTATKSISKTVGRYSGSGGYYPIYADCDSYTFTFNTAITVGAGKTVTLTITSAPGGSVLVLGKVGSPYASVSVTSSYTVSYDANGGSGSMSGHTVSPGSAVTLKANTFTAPASSSATYTITLNGNGGTSPDAKTCTRTTSKSFKQWRAGSTSGTAYAAGASYTPTGNTTMYAEWKSSTSGTVVLGSTTRSSSSANGYTVTFNGNGGTSSKSSQVQSNTTSYSFNGWGASASATSASYNSTTAYEFNADTTLYALWTASTTKGSVTATASRSNTTSTRKVTFNANGGSCSTASANSTATVSYTCKGWYTSASGGTKRCASGGSYVPTATETVYAQWDSSSSAYSAVSLPTATKSNSTSTYTVTFNGNGGSVSSTSATSTNTTSYTCSGWYTAASGGTKRGAAGGSYTPSAAETLYAQWSSSNSGYSAVTLPSGSRSGYVLLGFATSSSATSASYAVGASYTPTSNVTLYAIWSANAHTLTVNPKGGTWNGSTGTSTIAGSYGGTVSIPAPTRQGYIFAGWYKTAYGSLSNSATSNPLMTSSSNLPLVVYNNAGNGVVTHTRQSDTSAGYTYTTKITTSANTASPGLGGFYTLMNSASGATFIHVFRAKIPKGYYLQQHNNSVGNGSTFTWLTSTEGTGAWQDYAYKLVCGTSGSFSSFGHVALYHPSNSVPVTWYVGGSQITKNPTSAQTFTFGDSNTTLYAQWIPEGLVHIYNGSAWKPALTYVWNGSEWKMVIPYVWNGSEWKMSGG